MYLYEVKEIKIDKIPGKDNIKLFFIKLFIKFYFDIIKFYQ